MLLSLRKIWAMKAAAAAHLQGRLTPKRRGGRYAFVMGTVIWLQPAAWRD